MDTIWLPVLGAGSVTPFLQKALKPACTQERSAVACRQAFEGKDAVCTQEDMGASGHPLLGAATLSVTLTLQL